MPKQAIAAMKGKLMLAPDKKKTNTTTRPRRTRTTAAKVEPAKSRPGRTVKRKVAAVSRPAARRKKVEIPSILLEGDQPSFPVAGDGTARILRHKKIVHHGARPALALCALGSHPRAAIQAECAIRRRPS